MEFLRGLTSSITEPNWTCAATAIIVMNILQKGHCEQALEPRSGVPALPTFRANAHTYYRRRAYSVCRFKRTSVSSVLVLHSLKLGVEWCPLIRPENMTDLRVCLLDVAEGGA